MAGPIVLVTGAWHGGWAWRAVAERLRAAGRTVYAPTLPGLADGDDPGAHSLADVAASVAELVEREDLRDVTLVGHSWGGYPVTGAAPRIADRLRGLVYWGAFVPAAGRSLYDEVPPDYQGLFGQLAEASGDDTVALPFEVFAGAFMNDAGEEAQRVVHQLLVPQPFRYFTETVEPLDAAALGVEVAYVLGEADVALPPGEYGWARFADRLGVAARPAPGSHEALFTAPDGLAAALLDAMGAGAPA